MKRTLVAIALVVAAACGGGSDDGSDESSSPEVTTTTGAEEETTTTSEGPVQPEELPPGATPGLDDFSGDGILDPTCGTHDFGAGLVLRVPCEVSTPSEPPQGVTLVEGSLFGYNGSTDIDLDGISGSLLLSRDDAGTKVVIVTFNSGALFETGSDEISSPDELKLVIDRIMNGLFPNSRVQVRGHTDSTGSASSNIALSQRRAQKVADFLQSNGAETSELSAVGLGSTQPFAVEDGEEGRKFNRRVEIVMRVPE